MVSLCISATCGLCCSDFCLHVVPHVEFNIDFMLGQAREPFSGEVRIVTYYFDLLQLLPFKSKAFLWVSLPSALELMSAYGDGN